MPAYHFPISPGREFTDFLSRSEQIKDKRLADAIPREYFVPRASRGLAGFALSWALYLGAIAGIAFSPTWVLYIPLLVVAGLGGWGLHCIAHDCGHGSFSRSRRLNFAVGHVALLPLAYPFHAWRHVHNLHHANTNNLELDTDWRPVPAAVYDRLPWWEKGIYHATRTWAFWGGTINYWRVSGFRPSFFPKKEMRRDVRRSIWFVALVFAVYLSALAYFTGIRGVLLFFVAPWLATHAWFSATTLMHHSSADVPFVTSEHWTKNAGRMLLTTDYMYPGWLLFLTHNISVHTAHHVAPPIPFYNLVKAQAALKEAYPGMIRERRLRLRYLAGVVRRLHLYDPASGYYTDFSREQVTPETGLVKAGAVQAAP